MHRLAEPGEDLSGLPAPDIPAPAFVWLVEEATKPFARVRAMEIVDRLKP
jgi:hypothetical protein